MIMSFAELATGRDRALGRPARWLTSTRPLSVAVAAGTAALIGLTGCSSGSTAPGSAKPLSARQALRLAAIESGKVNSLTATLSVRPGGGAVGSLSGSMQIQLKPTVLLEASFTVTAAGSPTTNLDEILTSQAVYLKDSALTKATGKPWIKISLSELSSKTGLGFASLVQNLQGSNPLAQTKLFSISKNVHATGTKVINGVPTTGYTGSYQPSAAISELSPALRKLLGPTLRAMGASTVRFQVWIDGQHLIRRAVSYETLGGQPIISSYDVTSVNQPVNVTLPPASETRSLPKG